MSAVGGFPSYRDDSTLYRNGEAWQPNITVEFHSHDGFTLWAWTDDGRYVSRRFIGYTVAGAKHEMRRALTEGKA